jgi:hypothetical protein
VNKDATISKSKIAYSAPLRIDLYAFGVFLFWILVAHALMVLGLYANKPLLDLYYFRQTQNALTAYWLWRGGPWLAYETPVLGYPWAIPLEFPLYQGLVAMLRSIGIPIEIGGRLISFTFYLASLWPLWWLFRSLQLGRFAFLITGILFLSSPLYLYFSRTVTIESCALFFALLWLALLADFLTKSSITVLLSAIAAGTAAVLVKSTTFPPFVVLGGLLIFRGFLRNTLWPSPNPKLLGAVTACIVPVVIGYLWVIYSDTVRAENPFGAEIAPGGLADWIFGTWAQRASAELWRDTVLTRVMLDIFGYGLAIAAVPTVAALASRHNRAVAAAAITAFLMPFVVFTNVHLLHSYYQYANAIFALAAVGIGTGHIADTGRRWLAAVILVALLVLQLAYFWDTYAAILTKDYANIRPTLKIASVIKKNTSPDSGLIIIGFNSNSAIAYYSERKSLAIPRWASNDLMQRVFEHPQAFLGDRQFAGIVFCPDGPELYLDHVSLIRSFVADRPVLDDAGGCQLLGANR